jgi:hypothetical protein
VAGVKRPSFLKRQKEQQRKAKAEAKREARRARKHAPNHEDVDGPDTVEPMEERTEEGEDALL